MKFNIVKVTPEKAVEYLTKNTQNRRLDMFHVRKLAKEMTSGNWINNGDSIRFNSEGELIDGQHRLNAVVRAGVSVDMIVITDIEDPNAFKTIDTNGKPRNVGQVLGLMGVKNNTLASSVARRLIAWENTMDKSKWDLNSTEFRFVSAKEIIDYVEKNNEEIQQAILQMKSSLVFKRCGAGTGLLTAVIIINRYDEEKAFDFIEMLKTGYHPMVDSPVIALRDRLLTPPERRGQKWENELLACVIKAFNCFLHEKPLKALRWIGDGKNAERFPELGKLNRTQRKSSRSDIIQLELEGAE